MNNMAMANLVIEGCGLIFCIVGILCARMAYRVDADRNRFPIRLFGCVGVALLANMFGIIFKGDMSPLGLTIIPIANFLEFSFSYFVVWTFTEWLLNCLELSGKTTVHRVNTALIIVSEVLLIVSQFTHMYYYIDDANVYHRADLWLLSQVFAYMFYGFDVYLLVRYGKRLERQQVLTFAFFVATPAIASGIQMAFYGLFVVLFVCTLCAFIIFVQTLSRQVEAYCEKADELSRQQIELNESRMKLAMSQIQPHFLYNTLNAIHYLCEADPKLAQKTVANFSNYLRGNLGAVEENHLIPFEKELEHTQRFINLQQLRFGDELQITYFINCQDFLIPPLSLQVLADNAITHGICTREGGGNLTIRTDEYPDRYVVSIIDDGVGFDPEHYEADGKPHYGIKNVRTRLESMCNGRLEIESEKGLGTTARLIMYKEKQEGKHE